MIEVEVRVDPDEIAKEVRRQTANQIRSLLKKIIDEVQPLCRDAFRKEILRRAEYSALMKYGDSPSSLGSQFGLENPSAAVDPVVDAVVNDLVARPIAVRGAGRATTDFGGVEIVLSPNSLWALSSLPTASYKSNEHIIEWLSWLLFSGSSVVVADYFVYAGSTSAKSRTGGTIMVPSGKTKKNFRVRSPYAGTASDNWITRAAAKAAPKIKKILENAVRRAMS